MKTGTRQYKDVSGNPCTLDWLVKNEHEWAANQIRHRDKLETELEEAHDCLLNREKSLKAGGEAWAKAMTQRDEWKAVAESFAMVTAEFVNDWVKGDFKLDKLAACDAEAFRTPLEAFTKLKASDEPANDPDQRPGAPR